MKHEHGSKASRSRIQMAFVLCCVGTPVALEWLGREFAEE